MWGTPVRRKDGSFNGNTFAMGSYIRKRWIQHRILGAWREIHDRNLRITFSSYDFGSVFNLKFDENKCRIFYCDPPYRFSTNAGYSGKWTIEDEVRLYNHLRMIHDKGSYFIVNNFIESKGERNYDFG